jgi:hypothetical protein
MKIVIIVLMTLSSVSAFANTDCSELLKTTVGLLASGSLPVAGRYGVEVSILRENASIKKRDAAGNEESIPVNILRATAIFRSHGKSFKAWVASGLDANNGCTILKITQDGIQ